MTTTEYPSWPERSRPTARTLRDQRTLQQKAVRVHALSDPLGAAGFRQSRTRIQREGRARRLAAVAALASFVASLGLIVWNVPQSTPAGESAASPNQTIITAESQRQSTSLGALPPGLRAAPTAVPVASHTRTRSSD